MRCPKLVLTVIFLMHGLVSYPQIILWEEDFSTYGNGVSVGGDNNAPVGPDWISGGCSSCPGSTSDWWEVRSNRMEARDINDEIGFWQSEVVDITGFTTVSFSVDVSETGDLEGPYLFADNCIEENNQDYADVSYRINGGPWTKVINYLGWCGLHNSCNAHTLQGDDGSGQGDCRSSDVDWNSTTVIVSGLTGTTLEILLEVRNSAGNEYIRFDDIEVFSFTPLPVQWGEFTGTMTDIGVDLEWSTLSEVNNDYFTIERSMDGMHFHPIAEVAGHGNSSNTIQYQYFHPEPSLQTTYYRLKQVDFDGSTDLGATIAVEPKRRANRVLDFFPNPAYEFIRCDLSLLTLATEYTISDMVGNRLIEGAIKERIDVSGLADGTYIITFFTEDHPFSSTLLIKN